MIWILIGYESPSSCEPFEQLPPKKELFIKYFKTMSNAKHFAEGFFQGVAQERNLIFSGMAWDEVAYLDRGQRAKGYFINFGRIEFALNPLITED